ncbi:MAG: hypothetical protein KZQ97_22375 [Candidatus Thiodiazotropha sp. (ex Dulcina madagascariensis)]|nr:hypothetical protein [Candidatus Thiodiazotropha sp. (ex Dulcina madagascariensis)]
MKDLRFFELIFRHYEMELRIDMKKSIFTSSTIAAVFIVGTAISAISMAAPPEIQQQGLPDTDFPSLHHWYIGTTIPAESDVLYPDIDGDGIPEMEYECRSCHSLVRGPYGYYTLDPQYDDCSLCH